MNFTPQLTQSFVQDVPPGHLFLAQNDEGVEVIFLMLVQGSAVPSQYLVVQMIPRPTGTWWTATLPSDQIASDVNDWYVVAYEPDVDNFQYVELSTLTPQNPTTDPGHMISGQLALVGDRTCLVVLVVNPAIGYAMVDLKTGEPVDLSQPIPSQTTVIQKWSLRMRS